MAWNIDKVHSQVGFSVKHLMISNVHGEFKDYEAKLDINDSDLTHSYIDATVKTASVDTRDAQRDAHLRSADFFDSEKYPDMTFVSTLIEKKSHDRYHVTGNLTIRDVTKPVTFDVTEEGRGKDPWGGQRMGFSGQMSINRKDFGLVWNVALESGGWLVHEQVKVTINLEMVLVPETAPTTQASKS